MPNQDGEMIGPEVESEVTMPEETVSEMLQCGGSYCPEIVAEQRFLGKSDQKIASHLRTLAYETLSEAKTSDEGRARIAKIIESIGSG